MKVIKINENAIKRIVSETLKSILMENIQDEMISFHGSTTSFDNFDLSFIGTGEGTQVYGYGVYLTDVEDTGYWYAISNAYDKNKGKNKKYRGDDKTIINSIYSLLYVVKNWDKGIISIDEIKERVTKEFNKKTSVSKNLKIAYDLIMSAKSPEDIENMIVSRKKEAANDYKRYVYKVDIPDGPYIDWNNNDKQFLIDLFKKISENFDTSFYKGQIRTFGQMFEKLRGWKHPKEEPYANGIPQKDLCLFLSKLGYVGIRVRTGNKKGGDGRGHNLIVFNDKDVKIINKTKLGTIDSL